MKAFLVAVFISIFAKNLALDCKHCRVNIKDEGPDIPIQTETCRNPNETYCVFISGIDASHGTSLNFSYRGCYTDFHNMSEHYHDPGCPAGGTIINDNINGTMACCTGNFCNDEISTTTTFTSTLASTTMTSKANSMHFNLLSILCITFLFSLF